MSATDAGLVRNTFASLPRDGYESLIVEPDEIRNAGDGRVVVAFTMKARGQSSGLEAAQTAFMLIQLKDDLMRRVDLFFSLEDALAAAG